MKGKLKIIVVCAFALAAHSSFAASPAATQSWVKNYVRTNSNSRQLFADKTFTAYDQDGNENTITFGFKAYDNQAMVVTGSSAVSIPTNTVFVKVGKYAYRNTAMGASADIVGKVEKVGYEISDIVYEGTGVLKRVKSATTNDTFSVVYSLIVGDKEWKSERQKNGGELFREPNGSGMVEVAYAVVSDVVYEECTRPRVAMSFIDLLIGSAFAISPGQKEFTGNVKYDPDPPPVDGEYKELREWNRYWYTDASDAQTVVLRDITWVNANGDQVIYSVYHELVDIKSGEKLSDLSDRVDYLRSEDGINAMREQIDAAVEGAVNKIVWKMMTTGSGKDGYAKAVNESIDDVTSSVNTILNAYESAVADKIDGYGEHGWDETIKRINHEHTWVGTCGDYTCSAEGCNDTFAGDDSTSYPANHNYSNDGDDKKCKRCVNIVPKKSAFDFVECGERSPFEEDHAGFHNAGFDAPNCHCQCGDIKMNHELGDVDHFAPAYLEPNVCVAVWKCARCGEIVIDPGDESLGIDLDYGTGLTVSRDAHSLPSEYAYREEVINGVSMCVLTNTCNHMVDYGVPGCGQLIRTVDYHEKDEDVKHQKVSEIADDDLYHQAIIPCSHGFDGWIGDDGEELANVRWCGWTTNDNKSSHNYLHGGDGVIGEVGDPVKPPDKDGHYRYDICGRMKTNEDGEQEMTNDVYKGECGHVYVLSHRPHSGYEIYGNGRTTSREAGHDVSNVCNSCGYICYDRRQVHDIGHDKYYYDPATLPSVSFSWHIVSNTCDKCDTTYFLKNEEHEMSYAHRRVFFNGGQYVHHVSNFCFKCQHDYYAGTENHEDGFGVQWQVVKSDYPYHIEKNYHQYTNTCTGCRAKWGAEREHCDELGGAEYFIVDDDYHLTVSTCSQCGGVNTNKAEHVMTRTTDYVYVDAEHCATYKKCRYCEYVDPEPVVSEHVIGKMPGDYDYMTEEEAVEHGNQHYCKRCRDDRTKHAHNFVKVGREKCSGPVKQCILDEEGHEGCGLLVIYEEEGD